MRISEAEVATENGSRYVRQLLQHWGHRFPVNLGEHEGTVDLPGARGLFRMRADAIGIELALGDEADQARVEQVVAEHLQRFGFREQLQFHWKHSERN